MTSEVDPETLDEQASVIMKQGIALLERGDPAVLDEAIRAFTAALELRRQLPDSEPRYAFGLAASWLNLADALAGVPDGSRLPDALRAYDEGITVMKRLPMTEDPRYPRRLAVALQNRGLALRAADAAPLGEVTGSFMDAIDVLEQDYSVAISDRDLLLATVWVNVADTHAPRANTSSSATLAFNAADRALSLVASRESEEEHAAAIGLKARHVRCIAIAVAITSDPAHERVHALVHDATDAADEALELVRSWEQKGVDRFRPVAADFIRFGAQVYARYQPQFLDEFIAEQLDSSQSSEAYVDSAEIRAVAEDVQALLEPDSRS